MRIRSVISASFMFICLTSCIKGTNGPSIQNFLPGEGGPGDTVALLGVDFGFSPGYTKVYFNGTPGNVIFVTDTMIVALVPAGASSGKISISFGGHSASSSQDFIVYAGEWQRKTDIPSPGRINAYGFAVGDKGYIGGGNDGGHSLNDLWRYTASSDKWDAAANMPIAIESAVTMVIEGKAYVGIGRTDQGNTNRFFEFDPAAGTWNEKGNFPGQKRFGAIGLAVAEKGYAGTGEVAGTVLNDWWEYDPARDQWAQKADFPGEARSNGCGFVINGKIYFGLGEGKSDWWQYDPSLDVWTRKGDFPGTINFIAKGFAIDEKGYIAGGRQCWEYDTYADGWKQDAFIGFRTSAADFVLNGKSYYGTGLDGRNNPLQEFWEFTPGN